ncbi:MAG: phospholipid carrier-dependent glycosyltransferase [Anaerolineae bacterium]|nr:phospholipid carrier-dependent glycosyltransferase [Anaerolineae bacterium]
MKANGQSVIQRFTLLAIFLLGIGIRLYDLTDPPLDFHPARQLRSALIARSVYYQLNSNVSPSLREQAASLADLEMYEPPILETLVGATYLVIGSEQLWIARIYLAVFWAVGGLALLAILRRYTSLWAALLGLAFYFFIPFSVIASRSFQPDPWMIMWILLATHAALRWSETHTWKWAILVAILSAIALLVKIVAGFFIGAVLIAIAIQTYGFKRMLQTAQVWVIAILTLLPSAVYYWLLNPQRSSGFMAFWTGSLAHLVLTSNFYADWLAMIKGLTSLPIFVAALLGSLIIPKKIKLTVFGLWVGYFVYGMVFPYQYTTHEYYHLPLIALIAISLPPLLDVFFSSLKTQPWHSHVLASLILICSVGYSLWVARSVLYASDYRHEPISWQRVGQAIPANAKVIALTGDYGMRLRYYGWTKASAHWATQADSNLFSLAGNNTHNDVEHFAEMAHDMDYFLVTAFHELDSQPALRKQLEALPIFAQGDGYILFDLKHPVQ